MYIIEVARSSVEESSMKTQGSRFYLNNSYLLTIGKVKTGC